MKIKGLCVLAVLLTSSLAGAASNSAKEQYSLSCNSPNAIRYVFMSIAGQ